MSFRRHKIDCEIEQDFATGTKITLNGSFISSRPYYNHADPDDNSVLVAKKEKLGGYFLANLKISQALYRHGELFVSVENLFDKAYEDLYQFPSPGRTVWLGLKVGL